MIVRAYPIVTKDVTYVAESKFDSELILETNLTVSVHRAGPVLVINI